jgi:hypothetical protein
MPKTEKSMIREPGSYYLATVTEEHGIPLKRKHLVLPDNYRTKATLCGVEKKKSGRKVNWEWWQMLPMTAAHILRRLEKNGEGVVCPSCLKIARQLDNPSEVAEGETEEQTSPHGDEADENTPEDQ